MEKNSRLLIKYEQFLKNFKKGHFLYVIFFRKVKLPHNGDFSQQSEEDFVKLHDLFKRLYVFEVSPNKTQDQWIGLWIEHTRKQMLRLRKNAMNQRDVGVTKSKWIRHRLIIIT